MFDIEEKREIHIVRTEEGFDKACLSAYHQAVSLFDIDDDGHSKKVKGWERSSCSVCVEFVTVQISGGMGGIEYVYTFRVWAEKSE
jgi:hypothetical protein